MKDYSAFVGIPYADRGRDPALGLDCWGLVQLVEREVFGRNVPGYMSLYTSAKDGAAVSAAIRANFRAWRNVWPPDPGDVLIFRVNGEPWHAGVCIGQDMMIHSLEGHDSCVEPWNGTKWRQRVFGAYRWKS